MRLFDFLTIQFWEFFIVLDDSPMLNMRPANTFSQLIALHPFNKDFHKTKVFHCDGIQFTSSSKDHVFDVKSKNSLFSSEP